MPTKRANKKAAKKAAAYKKAEEEETKYIPMSDRHIVMTRAQAKEWRRINAAPPRQPTVRERELVAMYNRTVRR